MSLFNDILSQIENRMSKKSSQQETVAAIVSTVLHTTITADQITVRDTALSIKASPTIKMAVNLNKEKILKALQDAELPIETLRS
jgi:hypothetical protein